MNTKLMDGSPNFYEIPHLTELRPHSNVPPVYLATMMAEITGKDAGSEKERCQANKM